MLGNSKEKSQKEVRIPIKTYADAQGMSVSQVWKQIKNGSVFCEQDQGEVLIHDHMRQGAQSGPADLLDSIPIREAFQLPTSSEEEPQKKSISQKVDTAHFMSSAGLEGASDFSEKKQCIEKDFDASSAVGFKKTVQSPDETSYLPKPDQVFASELTHTAQWGMLVDHLSLAKEENKELLQFTNKSLDSVVELSKKNLAMKDEICELQKNEISLLKEKITQLLANLDQKEHQLRKIQQEKEDLEMLVSCSKNSPLRTGPLY